MRKRKHQPEPFDVAEFLRPHDDDMRSAVSHMFRGSPNLAVDERRSTELGIPDKGIPDTDIPELAQSPTLVQSPEVSTPVDEHPPSANTALPRVRQALQMRDGHSLGEQAVYQALWDNATPYSQNCRKIAIGYRALSGHCGLTVNNCKANLLSLTRKLAIEELATFTPIQSRSYLVYGETAVLQRRCRAGLTHVVKNRAVTFVDPATGKALL